MDNTQQETSNGAWYNTTSNEPAIAASIKAARIEKIGPFTTDPQDPDQEHLPISVSLLEEATDTEGQPVPIGKRISGRLFTSSKFGGADGNVRTKMRILMALHNLPVGVEGDRRLRELAATRPDWDPNDIRTAFEPFDQWVGTPVRVSIKVRRGDDGDRNNLTLLSATPKPGKG